MTSNATPQPRRRSLRRAVLLSVALAALGAAVTLAPGALARSHAAVAGPASIRSDPTYQDPTLLSRALASPVAAAYVRGGLDRQRNASFCGPTSAVEVLRSLGRPATQDDVLDGTGIAAPFGYVWGGLTLDEEAALLRARTGRTVTVLRDLDLAAFREELRHLDDPGRRYVANFSRVPLFGTGGGHHSPLGAYLPDEDLVLVLDVNASYGPWLVRADRLFEAVDTVDRASGRKRGLVRIE